MPSAGTADCTYINESGFLYVENAENPSRILLGRHPFIFNRFFLKKNRPLSDYLENTVP
jgi:hypothetical protein